MDEKIYSTVLADYPDVLNFNQLCQILQIGRHGTYRLLHENRIKHVRVGKKYVIAKLSVLDFLRGTK